MDACSNTCITDSFLHWQCILLVAPKGRYSHRSRLLSQGDRVCLLFGHLLFRNVSSLRRPFCIPTGIFYINRTANLLNIYLGAIFGQGRYVEGYFRNQIYLNHKLLEQRRISFYDVLGRCKEFLIESAGVRDVFTSERLTTSGNPGIERIRNGYNTNCCGDILIEVAPGWTIQNEDTQDTFQQRASLIPFPVIIYGANTPAQRVETPVTADRIAPTIAKAIRIRAPNACSATALK